VYSLYGHMMETETVKFPMRLSCVELGQVLGVVGNVRPAPHLHLEIKLAGPDTPGPGYSWANVYDEGWRHPSRFIVNRQAWTHPAHRWHLTLNDPVGLPSAPLPVADFSLMYLDGRTLRLATYDGRVLWRVVLNAPALAVIESRGQPTVVYADGLMQTVDGDGAPLDSWRLPLNASLNSDETLLSVHTTAPDSAFVRTSQGALLAVDMAERALRWRMEDVPSFGQIQVTPTLVALLTHDQRLLVLNQADGALLSSAQLRDSGSLALLPDGALALYGVGGLWRIDPANAGGEWALLNESARAQTGGVNALTVLPDNRIFAFDGATLRAYASDSGVEMWALPLAVSGQPQISVIDTDTVLLTSTHGQIIAVSHGGQLCGAAQVYGDDRATLWAALGSDNVLRVAVGNQVLGLDWAAFSLPCGT
ncbi:MAG: PQQ-binding-like beta-propeller repeat protein, partial [Armatimonadetes bacterium]|nr:PQQ-binding-like beta-propeller repeat protein [Anaerolineae bacterium]